MSQLILSIRSLQTSPWTTPSIGISFFGLLCYSFVCGSVAKPNKVEFCENRKKRPLMTEIHTRKRPMKTETLQFGGQILERLDCRHLLLITGESPPFQWSARGITPEAKSMIAVQILLVVDLLPKEAKLSLEMCFCSWPHRT